MGNDLSKRFKIFKYIDKILLIDVMILLILGSLLVFSASWPEGVFKFENGYHFIIRHLRSLLLGLLVMYLATLFDYKNYKKLALLIIFFAIIANLLLYTGLGDDRLGSTRWLDLPLIPAFMPSDILKVASVIFIAFYLDGIGTKVRNLKNTLIAAAFIVFFVLLVLQKDFSSSMVIFFGLSSILFVSGMRLNHLALLGVAAAGLGYFGINSPRFAYRIPRLLSFMDPFSTRLTSGYQLMNSLYALALGGVTGAGLGRGVQKFTYIPHVYNDFIFAVLGEEFGLVGTILLVLLFGVFMWRGYSIASNCRDKFGKYLAVGITSMIIIQAFFNIMVAIGFAPVTGITLPFISYGGTSLIMTMGSTGILFNISIKNNRRNNQ